MSESVLPEPTLPEAAAVVPPAPAEPVVSALPSPNGHPEEPEESTPSADGAAPGAGASTRPLGPDGKPKPRRRRGSRGGRNR
jgi:hypothetical protein